VRLAALVSRHRRVLAAASAAAAAAFALSALRSAAPPGVPIPTAARDLPSGATLRPSDVRPVTVPAAAAPAGIVRSGLAGRVLAGPVRRGEPLTDARLLGGRLLSGYGAGLVAVPLRMADAGSVRLLHPGDRIDVLAAPASLGGEGGGPAPGDLGTGDSGAASPREPPPRARPLAYAVPVIAVPGIGAGGGGTGGLDGPVEDGALVVVAARPDLAVTLAAPAASGARFAFVIVG
jgi:Flp pilus assembly protein CpaB